MRRAKKLARAPITTHSVWFGGDQQEQYRGQEYSMSNQLPPSNAPLGNGGNTGDEKEAGQTVEESEKSAHQNAEQAIGGNEDDTDPQEEQTEGITTLNENDVLLGRGRGPSTFIGNKKFSDLVMEYKSRYKATNKFNEKMVIAHTIYEEILDRGGRFLELTSKTDSKLVIKHGVWRVASWDVALERCKVMMWIMVFAQLNSLVLFRFVYHSL